jgi:membrane-bound lytic murein transglycosylase D
MSILLVSSLLCANVGAADLWSRLGPELDGIEHVDNDRIATERRWYTRHTSYLTRVSARATPYLFHVVERVRLRGMPLELALLPIMESAYDPFAYSHGRAAGIWQIIPGTGRHLGLEQDWWYDGRRDVTASTEAALNYLQEMHDRFDGDWLLALAAYNCGPRCVERAVSKNRSAGKNTDFWSLKLPRETRTYVPRLLALADIVATPEQYGIQLTAIPDQPHFEIVYIGGQIDLAQAAELAALEVGDIYQLNPGFNRWATAPEGPHELLIPVTATDAFTAGLNRLDPTQRVQWQRYTIREGDSLIRIARQFDTSVSVIRQANELSGNRIVAGKALMIPKAMATPQSYSLSANQRLASKQATGSGQQRQHLVKAGDSFWSISRRYGVSTRKLAEWNGMAIRDSIHPGQELVIWTASETLKQQPMTHGTITMRDPMVRKLGYRVRNGDSLARIAGKFNISVSDIVGWNQKLETGKYIHPGQLLTLYVDITET